MKWTTLVVDFGVVDLKSSKKFSYIYLSKNIADVPRFFNIELSVSSVEITIFLPEFKELIVKKHASSLPVKDIFNNNYKLFCDSMKSIQGESMSFFSYVFNFDDENKSHIMNMIQYTLLTIIPVLLVLRGIKHIIPEDDDSKGSLEILFESVGQVILIMISIWFINKIIQFIPTYSGENYPKFNEVTFIIPFILILATMQTKLGAKFNILIDADFKYNKENVALLSFDIQF